MPRKNGSPWLHDEQTQKKNPKIIYFLERIYIAEQIPFQNNAGKGIGHGVLMGIRSLTENLTSISR